MTLLLSRRLLLTDITISQTSIQHIIGSFCSSTVQQLPQATDLPAPAAQLLLGLQPRLRLSTLPWGRRSLCQAADVLLHSRALPALQSLALTTREASRPDQRPAPAAAATIHFRAPASTPAAADYGQLFFQPSDGSAQGDFALMSKIHADAPRKTKARCERRL